MASRIESWNGEQVFARFKNEAMEKGNAFMDDVVSVAKIGCPVDPVTFREGKWSKAHVSFTPKTGRNKGKLVSFDTEKRWMGRYPGQLRSTIRRTNKPMSGTIRVYVGNFKVYWAFMIEKSGYHDRSGNFHPPLHFLQGTFHSMKGGFLNRLQGGV